jgi:hypothetical protein
LHGQIAVPLDSPITRLEDLKGQEVVFAGPEAFIGYKVPFAHLLSKNIDVKAVFAGNQNAAFAQLFAGKAKAVGSNSALIDGYSAREGKKFRVLWTSEGFHDLALMASSKVPERDVKAVASAFINSIATRSARPSDQILRRSRARPTGVFPAREGSDYMPIDASSVGAGQPALTAPHAQCPRPLVAGIADRARLCAYSRSCCCSSGAVWCSFTSTRTTRRSTSAELGNHVIELAAQTVADRP